jgi:hypothetical protein
LCIRKKREAEPAERAGGCYGTIIILRIYPAQPDVRDLFWSSNTGLYTYARSCAPEYALTAKREVEINYILEQANFDGIEAGVGENVFTDIEKLNTTYMSAAREAAELIEMNNEVGPQQNFIYSRSINELPRE